MEDAPSPHSLGSPPSWSWSLNIGDDGVLELRLPLTLPTDSGPEAVQNSGQGLYGVVPIFGILWDEVWKGVPGIVTCANCLELRMR